MAPRIAHTTLAAALVLSTFLGTGCKWLATETSPDTDPESTIQQAQAANAATQVQLEAKTIELARKQAELDQSLQRVQLLEEELATVRADLEFVERQFVLFERRLTNEETKASAVSAVAEVQLLRDKLQTETPLDEETLREVEDRLAASGVLIDKRKYTAAVYYANRAMRALNRAERLRNAFIDGDALVVAVSKANLRQGPGGKFNVVTRLTYGTAVVKLEKNNEWMKVRTRDGQTGWIHSSLLQ